MLEKISIALFALFLSANTVTFGQRPDVQNVLDSASIEQQFETMFERSSRYEEYKVIREAWLNKFRKNLNDSIGNFRRNIVENRTVIAQKNKEIETLNENLAGTKEELDQAIKEKNSLKLLGIKMDKTFYNLVMWIIVAGLIFLLIIVFLMFRKSKSMTDETVSSLDQLKSEYEEYRNQSRLKMEKIKREHLDEILKLKSGQ